MSDGWCKVCGFQSNRCTCVRPGMDSCGETYIPVPEWRGDHWAPWNVATERPMQWPEWMTPERITTLPHPLYMPGERVRFKWSRGQVHVGTVRRIQLHGGTCRLYELRDPDLIIKRRYDRTHMHYTIDWQSHGRWVNEDHILGRE